MPIKIKDADEKYWPKKDNETHKEYKKRIKAIKIDIQTDRMMRDEVL